MLSLALIVAAILAVAMFAVDTDALDDMQGHQPPAERDGPSLHPPEDRFMTEERLAADDRFPGPPPEDLSSTPKEEPPPDGPVIVFDASGIPAHAPAKLVKEMAGVLEKRDSFDHEATVMVFDPHGAEHPDDALSKALKAMGLVFVTDLQELDVPYVVSKLPSDGNVKSSTLHKILQFLDANESSLYNLIYSMITEMDDHSTCDRMASLVREDEEMTLVPSLPDTESDDDSDSSETVYVVLAAPSTAETYLCTHAFDGGAFTSQ